ncbi:excitatory amino acid transporter 1-like isoform X2 [Tachypleus tridentatus]|uniref:excitatory amino acid transporter 1-like isoform X2 n=1 Tax=Tachypleus tridentatus TaxID=6853 RepID=UPI003FD27829
MDLQDNKELSLSVQSKRKKRETFIRQNLLTLLTFLAVIIGISIGFGLREAKTWTKREVMYVYFPGELFLRILRCLTLPLIMSSLISSVGNLDTKLSGKIGLRAICYYLITTVLAIILGIVLVVSIRPGAGNFDDKELVEKSARESTTADALMDIVRNLFPPNLFQATIEQYKTVITHPESSENDTFRENVTEVSKDEWDISGEFISSTNILGLVVFSLVLGVTLANMKDKGKPLLDVVTSLSEAMMLITAKVVWFTPIGVLFLIAAKLIEMEDLSAVAGQLGLFTLTILTGFLIHSVIILPAVYSIITKTWPFTFIYNMSQSLITAFGTASSSATLPVTISCLEQKNKVDARISRFCLPIGATINMDGTALYEAVAAIFVAQFRNVSLTAGKIIAIRDRFRTAVNVLGDAFGAGIVAHLSSKELQVIDI